MTSFGDKMRRARHAAEASDWNPGPGTHEAIVVEGDAFESKAGDEYAKTTLRLVRPGDPDDGRTWDHLMGFGSDQQAAINAGQLAMYGIENDVLDNLDDVEDLARHMAELEGLHVTVSCKPRRDGDGVWTSIIGSRTGKSDIPEDQASFSLGDQRRGVQPPASAIAGEVDEDPIPY